MHILRAPTLQGLILSCRNFTRWFARKLSPKCDAEFSCFSETSKSRKVQMSRDRFLKKPFEDPICTNKLK